MARRKDEEEKNLQNKKTIGIPKVQHTRLGFAFLWGRRWASLFHGETMRRWSVGRNQDYIMYVYDNRDIYTKTITNVNSHINVPICYIVIYIYSV